MNLTHFELFGLPQSFAIDSQRLESAYRDVQSRVHPDKFSSASATEQRLALQWATQANEAHRVLRDPLARARYLCELQGVDVQSESNVAMPPEFLMQQMEWREQLDDARRQRAFDALDRIDAELQRTRDGELEQLATSFERSDIDAASRGVRRLMFIERFADEVADAHALFEAN